MSKKVTLNIDITPEGKIQSEPIGTEGKECLELMAFLDTIPGLIVEEVTHNDDMKKQKSYISSTQTVKQ